MRNPTDQSLKNAILLTRADLQKMMYEETAFALFRLRRESFENGEKAGKMLALRLKQMENKQAIPAIRNENDELLSEGTAINESFRSFYSNPYKSTHNASESDMDAFFDQINLPCVNPVDKEQLESAITKAEIETAIGEMATGKTPGEDGLGIEFYKAFKEHLTPFLHLLYNEMLQEGRLSPSMCKANISLIHKSGKDPLLRSNYRPISLVNCDYKIFAKILATRLKKVVPSIIHIDQVGFIPGRLSSNNMRRIFQVMLEAEVSPEPAIAASLDAEKAFDQLEFKFLFHTLRKFGFGPRFISWVRALYNSPISSIKTNGLISKPFALQRGVRQGCPVSPLLFVIALEPLACAIRSNNVIQGVNLHGYNFRLNMYADDILLTLTNPKVSIPAVLELVDLFGNLSGYKINWGKSEAIPLNPHTFRSDLGDAPFVWKSKGMKYLGVNIISPITDIFGLNGPNMLQSIKDDLSRWTALPMSLWGRVEILKMNVLPRLAFCISAIPLEFPARWFQEIRSIFIQFIWNNKKPRISYKKLVVPRSKGGLGVPDIFQYYLAYNARYPLTWAYLEDPIVSSWNWLEKNILADKNISIASLWYSPKLPRSIDNAIVRFSCWIAKQLHTRLKLEGISLPSYPIWNNLDFSTGEGTLNDETWKRQNIRTIGQVYEQKLLPLDQIKTTFNLPATAFFTYAQIYSVIQAKCKKGSCPCSLQRLDKQLKRITTAKGAVSSIYTLLSNNSPNAYLSTHQAWDQDLKVALSPSEWETLWRKSIYSSKCVQFRIIQYKILCRSYLTPVTLSKIEGNNDNNCWHGCGNRGTLFHLIWECPDVVTFWSMVVSTMSEFFRVTFLVCPLACIVGQAPEGVRDRTIKRLWSLGCLTAKRIILRNWKERKQGCFSKDGWLGEYLDLLNMERAACLLKDFDKRLDNQWETVRSRLV